MGSSTANLEKLNLFGLRNSHYENHIAANKQDIHSLLELGNFLNLLSDGEPRNEKEVNQVIAIVNKSLCDFNYLQAADGKLDFAHLLVNALEKDPELFSGTLVMLFAFLESLLEAAAALKQRKHIPEWWDKASNKKDKQALEKRLITLEENLCKSIKLALKQSYESFDSFIASYPDAAFNHKLIKQALAAV